MSDGWGSRKNNYDNSKKVYEKDHYIILQVKSGKRVGFIAYNTRKEWEDGHTHLESFNMAKTIIGNVINRKKPKTKNEYLLRSHIRISDDPAYVSFIEHLIEVKKDKGRHEYINRKF